MIEVFKYLEEFCNHDNIVITNDSIVFEINDFDIVIEYEIEGVIKTLNLSDSFCEWGEIDFNLLNTLPISLIKIRQFVRINEDDEDLFTMPISVEAVNFYKQIKRKFPGITNKCPNVGQLIIEDVCIMCPYNFFDYGWELEIAEKYWTEQALYSWLAEYENAYSVPYFYRKGTCKLVDSLELNILNLSTKVRRLGYLKLLVKFVDQEKSVPISKFNKKFEKYCTAFSEALIKRKGNKGNIAVTKTGNSAKPYVELGLSLGLIRKDSMSIRLGKKGKVYSILKQSIEENLESNIFDLSDFDTTFFLELLLKADYFYIRIILGYIYEQEAASEKELRSSFQHLLMDDISHLIDSAQLQSSSKVLQLKIIERRISAWNKPDVYMEHVVTPRINWLIDLGLLEEAIGHNLRLTLNGEKLYENILLWNDMRYYPLICPDAFIDSFFFKVLNLMYCDVSRQLNNMQPFIQKYLSIGFELFKTLAPNRIAFSQFNLYLKNMLFWKEGFVLDTSDFLNKFADEEINGYICKIQHQYKDGYIQKLS